MTGFFESLFTHSPKRRRTASLHTEKQLDALVESFAQASIARQALSRSQSSLPPSYALPLSSSGGLYRQEIPLPRPAPIETARPPVKVWQASPSPVYENPFLPPIERLPRPASEPFLYAPPPVSLPATPKKSRAVEPQGKPNQCRGTTTAGKRCTRIVGAGASAPASPARGKRRSADVQSPLTEANLTHLNRVLSRKGRRKGPAPLSDSEDSAGEDNDELPKFCHQHARAAVEEPGTFAGRHGTWIRFDDWIPAHLPQETRIQLRYEMARPVTEGDKPGYLYVHEMARTSGSASPITLLKIGRSVKPIARLSQWKNQCPSRTPIVRGLFPLPFGRSGATLGGALAINPVPAPNHHRWERLVLIEIAGRAQLVYGDKSKEGKCVDCGKRHTELFSVRKGAYELFVIDVIEKWQKWCTQIL